MSVAPEPNASSRPTEPKKPHLSRKISKIQRSATVQTLVGTVPPPLRRSKLGKLAFFLVAIGAAIFCAFQVYGLAHKFFSFEPTTVISVLSGDPAVNISLHCSFKPFLQDWLAEDFIDFLLGEGMRIKYHGNVVNRSTVLPLALISRHMNYYIDDELCIPSHNVNVTDDYYENSTFDFESPGFQSYLAEVQRSLAAERDDTKAIQIGNYALATFPWTFFYEQYMGKFLFPVTVTSMTKGCEGIVKVFKKDGPFMRFTFVIPRLSCLPLQIDILNPGTVAFTLSAGTASTMPSTGLALRPSQAESAQKINGGYGYTLIAGLGTVGRQPRFCNPELNPETDCMQQCVGKKVTAKEKKDSYKKYYDALDPHAFWRHPNDPTTAGQFYLDNICSLRNRQKLAKIGVGAEFYEKLNSTKKSCEKHCHKCGTCRLQCAETKVTLHFPDAPQVLGFLPNGEERVEARVQLDQSSGEILDTQFQVGYTFPLFVSDVGGIVKLAATIIGCVALAAILYKCATMRRKAYPEGEEDHTEDAGTKFAETFMEFFE